MKEKGPSRRGSAHICAVHRALLFTLLLTASLAHAEAQDDLLNSGKKAFADGFYDVAAGSFQRVLSDYPQSPAAVEAEYMIGVSRFYAGKWDESLAALEGFRTRHASSPLAPRASYWIGAAQLRMGRYEKALRALSAPGQDTSLPGPYTAHASLLRGIALEGLGRDVEASAAYRGILAAGSDPSIAPEASFRLAGVEYRAGHFPSARQLYGKILIDYPQSSFVKDALFFLAECDLAVGETQSAEKRYATLLSLYPGSPWREAAMYRLADTAYRRKDLPEALSRLQGLQGQFPRGSYAASAQRLKADILFDQKRYEESLMAYRAAAAALPPGKERQSAFYAAGLSELMLGRKTEAAQDFARAGSGGGREIGERASYQRAVLLAGEGQDDNAAAALAGYMDEFPAGAHAEEVLKLLASLLEAKGDFEKSAVRWDTLVRRFPRSRSLPEYVFHRGTALMRSSQTGALDDFQRIIRDFPGSDLRDESAFLVGYIYAGRGEHARALPFFQSVARSAAGTDLGDRSQLSVGVSYFNMGSFDKALASLESLRSARPGGEQEGTAALYVGRTLYRMERLADAAERLSSAAAILELPPPGKPASVPGRETEAADARWWLGWSLFRLGRLQEAHDAFVSLAQRHPSDPRASEALYRAGICDSTLGDDAAAVDLFDQAASQPSQIREQALYEKGWAQQRLGDGEAGRETFRELAREFPDGRLAPEAFFKIAMKSFDEGRFADARAGFQGVAASFPRSALAGQALYWSAESARQAGDFSGAVEGFWSLFAASTPESLLTASLAGFGMSLETLKSPDAARQSAARARSTRGLDPRIAAGVLLSSGRVLLADSPSEALAAAADAGRMSPPEPWAGEAALLSGRCYAALGDTARALDILAALSDTRIDEVGAQATLERARTLEKTGSPRDALVQYLRVPYVFPGSEDLAGESLFNAARLSLQQGDREGSARISVMLRKRYPESPWTARLNELGSGAGGVLRALP